MAADCMLRTIMLALAITFTTLVPASAQEITAAKRAACQID
jgi:hypothetical protein